MNKAEEMELARLCKFFLLGPFSITDTDDNSYTPKSKKTCAMLAMLSLSPRATRSRVWLRDKLWSERTEEQGSSSLRQALLDARKCLADLGDDLIIADKKSIALNLERIEIDMIEYLDQSNKDNTDLSHLLREDLLEGMDVQDPEFEDWLTLERQIWENKASRSANSDESRKEPELPLKQISEGKVNRYFTSVVAIHFHQSKDLDAFGFDDCLELVREHLENRGGNIYHVTNSTILIEFPRAIDGANFSIELSSGLNKFICLSFGIGYGQVHQKGDDLSGIEVDEAINASIRAQQHQVITSEALNRKLNHNSSLLFDALSINGDNSQQYMLTKSIHEGVNESANVENDNMAEFIGHKGPSIAVLPFRASTPSSQEYIGEGIADDLILALTQNKWLRVISKNSSFNYESNVELTADIAAQLGVDYIVSGVLKLNNNQVDIVITLENGKSNEIVYSEPFSVGIDEVMRLQELVAGRVTARLMQKLGMTEQLRAYESSIDDLNTWQLVHRGNWHMSRRTAKGVERAKQYYESALELDPYQTDALLALSWWYFWNGWTLFGAVNTDEAFKQSKRLCRNAMLMDSSDGRTHCYLGTIAIMQQKADLALDFLNEAIQLNGSISLAHSSRGSANLLLGNPQLAVDDLKAGLALNPSDNYRFHTLGELASASFFAGDYDTALEVAEDANFLAPRYWYPRIVKLACYKSRDNEGDRAAAMAEAEKLSNLNKGLKRETVAAIPFQKRDYSKILVDAFEKF